MVYVSGPKDKMRILDLQRYGTPIINTTSHAKGLWSRELSPFLLGPVKLYNGYTAKNVENGWQYCKVYKEHVNGSGDPKPKYFEWAKAGWNKEKADRYPMGKGAIPEYSYWDGEKLGYIEARKKIYIPLYIKAVAKTNAYQKLKAIYREGRDLYLWDFDGYDYIRMQKSLDEVLNDPDHKMGHAFVLAMMLTRKDNILKMLEA